MFNSTTIDIATGLALVFVVVATIAAGVNEVLSRLADARAKTLWLALQNLLSSSGPTGANLGVVTAFRFVLNKDDARPRAEIRPTAADLSAASDPNAVEAIHALLATPSIRSLDPVVTKGKSTKVDNIPSAVFAAALLELATLEAGSTSSDPISQKLTDLAAKYPGTPLGVFLSNIAVPIGNDLDQYIATLSAWFDQNMTTLTTIYRRNVRYVLAVIGLAAAVVFNIDSIAITQTLSRDAEIRNAVVLLADDVAQTDVTNAEICIDVPTTDPDRDLKCAQQALNRLAELKVPVLGDWNATTWKASWQGDPQAVTGHILGLLITAGAVSFGSQFWRDVLARLSGLRRAT